MSHYGYKVVYPELSCELVSPPIPRWRAVWYWVCEHAPIAGMALGWAILVTSLKYL